MRRGELQIEIKSFTSFDLIGENGEFWDLWELPDQGNVRIDFDIEIGEKGGDAADIFTSVIFTESAKGECLKMNGNSRECKGGAGAIDRRESIAEFVTVARSGSTCGRI